MRNEAASGGAGRREVVRVWWRTGGTRLVVVSCSAGQDRAARGDARLSRLPYDRREARGGRTDGVGWVARSGGAGQEEA
jgi:hypothetical protein